MEFFSKSSTDKKVKALDELFQEVGTYRKSEDLKELFGFIKKFPRIAPYNAFLLHIQKPGSEFVASAFDWGKQFNRTIKPEARPLVILKPFGPVEFVFELGDTVGSDPFPEEFLHPFQVDGTLPDSTLDLLIKNLSRDGITYHERDDGTASAGVIMSAKEDIIQLIGDKNVKVLYQVIINKNFSPEEKFATITHELGHLYCGHLGSPDTTWWPERKTENICTKEFEAESVTWLVCERLGIKNPSASYLSNYLEGNNKIPNVSLEAILKAAGMVEAMTMRKFTIRKEIIIKPKEES